MAPALPMADCAFELTLPPLPLGCTEQSQIDGAPLGAQICTPGVPDGQSHGTFVPGTQSAVAAGEPEHAAISVLNANPKFRT